MKMGLYNKNVKLQTKECHTIRQSLNEHNDCTVRAISNFCKCDYSTAHEYVKKKFKRKHRKGIAFAEIMNKREGLFLPKKQKYKRLKNHSGSYDRNGNIWSPNQFPLVSRTKKGLLKRMYVGEFIEQHNKGSYILVVSNHTFTIVDGVIFGNEADRYNLSDSEQMKRPILEAYFKV
jgi:hypothetical protein